MCLRVSHTNRRLFFVPGMPLFFQKMVLLINKEDGDLSFLVSVLIPAF